MRNGFNIGARVLFLRLPKGSLRFFLVRVILYQGSTFKTTCWTLLGRAAGGSDKSAALNELVQLYWYPLYAFCRRQGHSDHDAMDLTQGFLTSLIESESIARVEQSRGRFRNFLLVSFKNYLKKQHRHSQAQCRGGNGIQISIDSLQFSARYCDEVWDPTESPERIYDRQCVSAMLETVTQKLAETYRRVGKQDLFEAISPQMLTPNEAVSRSELSVKLGLTPAAINMALHRMRLKFAQLLRHEISGSIGQGESVEEELSDLLRVFAS